MMDMDKILTNLSITGLKIESADYAVVSKMKQAGFPRFRIALKGIYSYLLLCSFSIFFTRLEFIGE